MSYNTENVRHAYKSRYNLESQNQVILSMIIDSKKWDYLVTKKLSALLRGETSKHDRYFYCLNCFHSHSTKDKLKKHKDVCEKHNYCYVEMQKEDNKVLKYNHGEKSMKVPFIVYPDLKSLLEKMNTCYNNLEKSSTTKINKHTASHYLLFTKCLFDVTKNKLDSNRSKDCMERFCNNFKEHVTKIINYEKKEMIPLTREEK